MFETRDMLGVLVRCADAQANFGLARREEQLKIALRDEESQPVKLQRLCGDVAQLQRDMQEVLSILKGGALPVHSAGGVAQQQRADAATHSPRPAASSHPPVVAAREYVGPAPGAVRVVDISASAGNDGGTDLQQLSVTLPRE